MLLKLQQSIKGKKRGKVGPSTISFTDVWSLPISKGAPHSQEMYSSEFGEIYYTRSFFFLYHQQWAKSTIGEEKLPEISSGICCQKKKQKKAPGRGGERGLWHMTSKPCELQHRKRVREDKESTSASGKGVLTRRVWAWTVRLVKRSSVIDGKKSTRGLLFSL